jgi:hypothetical protein
MKNLLERDVAHMSSPLVCALGRGRTEQKTSECRCEARFFARKLDRERDAGLPMDSIARKQRVCVVQMRVSPMPFRLWLGHCFGACATPGGTRSSASLKAPLRGLGSAQNKFENSGRERRPNFFRFPPRKQTFGAWESRPLARLRPGVTRADREFKTETLPCI